ncbi:MAG: tetratricopeptide repeat protein [Phycisphaerae bacterium]|nr:tetratricopeptide repeat protein [Phycisphaerae bacterium]
MPTARTHASHALATRRRRLLGILLLALLAAIVYQPALDADWLDWDDDKYVFNNDAVLADDGLRTIWTSFELDQFAPLTFTSFWLEHRIAGLDPRLYHFTNLLLHFINALLVAKLVRTLGIGDVAAWFAAAFYLVHPTQVASVAWITERKNVLSTACFLVSLIAGLRAFACNSRRDYALSLACVIAALLSKSTTLTLPLCLLIGIHWLCPPITARRALRLTPYLLFAITAGFVAAASEHGKTGLNLPSGPPSLVVASTLWFYVAKTLAPIGLSPIYERWTITAADARPWLAVAGSILVVWMIHSWRRRIDPRALWAGSFFIIALLPISGLVYYRGLDLSLVWHHHLYLPLVGAAVLVGLLVEKLDIERASPLYLRRPRHLIAMAALAALAIAARLEIRTWRDTHALFTRAIERAPDSPVAHNGYGLVLAQAGDHAAAIRHFEKTLEMCPQYREPYINLGNSLAAAGRPHEAIPLFERVLGIDENYFEGHYNLAYTLAEIGQLERAERSYRRAAELRPALPAVHFNLGLTLLRLGRVDAARAEFERTLTLDPTHARAAELRAQCSSRPAR